MIILVGAEYVHKAGGPNVFVNNVRVSGVEFQRTDGSLGKLDRHIFAAEYKDSGNHNHEAYCCPVHGIHTNPHKHCVLR